MYIVQDFFFLIHHFYSPNIAIVTQGTIWYHRSGANAGVELTEVDVFEILTS